MTKKLKYDELWEEKEKVQFELLETKSKLAHLKEIIEKFFGKGRTRISILGYDNEDSVAYLPDQIRINMGLGDSCAPMVLHITLELNTKKNQVLIRGNSQLKIDMMATNSFSLHF